MRLYRSVAKEGLVALAANPEVAGVADAVLCGVGNGINRAYLVTPRLYLNKDGKIAFARYDLDFAELGVITQPHDATPFQRQEKRRDVFRDIAPSQRFG